MVTPFWLMSHTFPFGLQAPGDPGWPGGHDAIEGDGAPVRLPEAGDLAGFDAEAVPVDDGFTAALIDGYPARLGGDGGVAVRHMTADGIGADARGGRQHGDGEYEG